MNSYFSETIAAYDISVVRCIEINEYMNIKGQDHSLALASCPNEYMKSWECKKSMSFFNILTKVAHILKI